MYWSAGWLLECELAQLRDVDEGLSWTGVWVPSPNTGPGWATPPPRVGSVAACQLPVRAVASCLCSSWEQPDQQAVTHGAGEKSEASSVEQAVVWPWAHHGSESGWGDCPLSSFTRLECCR